MLWKIIIRASVQLKTRVGRNILLRHIFRPKFAYLNLEYCRSLGYVYSTGWESEEMHIKTKNPLLFPTVAEPGGRSARRELNWKLFPSQKYRRPRWPGKSGRGKIFSLVLSLVIVQRVQKFGGVKRGKCFFEFSFSYAWSSYRRSEKGQFRGGVFNLFSRADSQGSPTWFWIRLNEEVHWT